MPASWRRIIPMGMHRGHLSVTQPKMSPATVYLEPFSFVFACREHSRGWSQPWVCAGWAGGSPAKENLKIFQFFIPALDLLPLIVSEPFWEGVSPAGSRILHPWQLSSSFTSIPCGAGSLDGARPPLEEDPEGSSLHNLHNHPSISVFPGAAGSLRAHFWAWQLIPFVFPSQCCCPKEEE